MSKVYVLSANMEYEGSRIAGIFAMRELAESRKLKLDEQMELRPDYSESNTEEDQEKTYEAICEWREKHPEAASHEFCIFSIEEHELEGGDQFIATPDICSAEKLMGNLINNNSCGIMDNEYVFRESALRAALPALLTASKEGV